VILVLNALTPRAAFRASARKGMKAMDMQASVRTSMNVKTGRMTAMQTQNAMIQMAVTIASVTMDTQVVAILGIVRLAFVKTETIVAIKMQFALPTKSVIPVCVKKDT